jgi:hypothetical protein
LLYFSSYLVKPILLVTVLYGTHLSEIYQTKDQAYLRVGQYLYLSQSYEFWNYYVLTKCHGLISLFYDAFSEDRVNNEHFGY